MHGLGNTGSRVGLKPKRWRFVYVDNGDAFDLSGCPSKTRLGIGSTKIALLGGVTHKGCDAMDIALCVGCKGVARDHQLGGFFGVGLLKEDDSDMV